MKADLPPDIRLLFDAYVSATGLSLSLSYERERALSDLVARGITAEDVTAVLGRLKRMIARGDKGYTEASLDFRNAVLNVDTFEERALRLRQEAFRRKGAQPKQVPVTRGDVTVLDEQQPKEPIPISKNLVAETLKQIAENL